MKSYHHKQGYTFLELILATAVGSVVIAGMYASYGIIAQQYQRGSNFGHVQENGMATLNLISRDIRMAGHKAVDTNIESNYGTIATPITINDSGNACCDSITIIYDRALDERLRVQYYTTAQTNPARNTLYQDIDQWDGAAWIAQSATALVTDFVEDLQFSGSNNNSNGFPTLVDISLVLRAENEGNKTTNYSKNSYDVGNYTISTNDNFHRDEFNGTINIRNLQD